MPLEQETIGLLIGGFSIVVGLLSLITIILLIRSKSSAYIFLLLHFALLSSAFYFFIKAVSFDYMHPMASEEISLQIGLSGIIWAVSMVCLLISFLLLSNRVPR